MSNEKHGKFENLRPIIEEKHDFCASLYRNKEQKEPSLKLCAKGSYDIDVLKVGAVALIALTALTVANASAVIKKAKYERLKKLNAKLKQEINYLKK